MKKSKNDKMNMCFTPHVMMHSLFGLGLGILVATWFDGLRHWWIGAVVIVLSVVLDATRKP